MSAATHKRLFFALWPPAELQAEISSATADVLVASKGRPQAEKNIHLTLAFLHNVEIERLECVCDAASRVEVRPFKLTLDRFAYWRRSKILSLSTSSIPDELEQLFDQIWTELGACDFRREERPFKAHVTLARKARHGSRDPLPKPIVWRIDEFVLVESVPGPKGRDYPILARWPLT
ncbi:MAG: RNA 2',3'-cyclic phosphodiesterase [Gammaproteobacteria bacterium]